MIACPVCGRDNPERSKFCNECGSLIAGDIGPAQSRRVVTIVFSDLVDSTAMGEAMDPESVRGAIARYFLTMRAILERHGGVVEKFIGDAVMAVFGIPTLHEDDALRAVRAAYEMKGALAGLNHELESSFGIAIANRTGVNTGEVVVGDPGAGGTLATGDTVNVAARLEQAAGTNEVLIGETTYRLVRHAAGVEPVEPLPLKGKAEPVPAYRLLNLSKGPTMRSRRVRSPLVGREEELGSLLGSFHETVRLSTCRLVSVVGMPGVGKSRLVEELLAQVSDGATVLRGRCLSYGEGITYWPMGEAIRQASGIQDEDPPQVARDKLGCVFETDEHASLVVTRLGAMLGLLDAPGSPEETAWAVRQFLESLARRGPVALVLDDIHWAEDALLDLVISVAGGTRGVPLFIVCLARPELLERRPRWADRSGGAVVISLDVLPEEAAEILMDNILGGAAIDAQAKDRIEAAAGGNPLFVEELLGMMIDDGIFRREDDRWVQAIDLSSIPIPPTIDALLSARLDRLPAQDREVLASASVQGQVFSRDAVTSLVAPGLKAEVPGALAALEDRALIGRVGPSVAGEETYRFRHILIRDAAYRAQPKGRRAELHEAFADWLGARVVQRLAEYEEILGFHLEQAVELRSELRPPTPDDRMLSARAGIHLGSAGKRATTRGDVSAADNLLTRAAALFDVRDANRIELLPLLGETLTSAGDFARARGVFDEAIALGHQVDDPLVEARASTGRLHLRRRFQASGWTEESLREANRIISVCRQLDDEAGLARAYSLIAAAEWSGLQGAKTQQACEAAAQHARLAGDPRQEFASLTMSCWPIVFGPVPVPEAIELCTSILRRVRGNPFAEAMTLTNLALLHAMAGDIDRGRDLASDGCATLTEFGYTVEAAAWRGLTLGDIETLLGDAETAERAFRNALDSLHGTGDRWYAASLSARMARSLSVQERYAEAEEAVRVSEDAAADDDLAAQMDWRGAKARALAGLGMQTEALDLASEAVRLSEASDLIVVRAWMLEDLAAVLETVGRHQDARRTWRLVLSLRELKGDVASVANLRARLP